MDTPSFDPEGLVRPALKSIALYLSIIVISVMATVKPAHADGQVDPINVYTINSGGFNNGCFGKASVVEAIQCEVDFENSFLDADYAQISSWGGYDIAICQRAVAHDLIVSNPNLYSFKVSPVYRLFAYMPPNPKIAVCTGGGETSSSINVIPSSCPSNTNAGFPCICKTGYKPDPTHTSCVSANCPANMSGSPCACNAGFVPNPYGAGCVEEQYTISEPQGQAQLPDVEPGLSREVSVRVTNAQTGQPKEGVVVRLHLDVDLTSGGHDHGETHMRRPRGTINSSNCVVEPDSASQDTYNCTTGADGYTGFTFGAPDASGTHSITATCISHACSGSKTIKIDVKVDGLWPIPDSAYYTLIEDGSSQVIGSTENHTSNHYLTNTSALKLWRLAADFYDYQIRNGAMSPTLLHLNDASLKWGGKFDIAGKWIGMHYEHNKGTVVDIRANTASGHIPESSFVDFENMATVLNADAQLHCSANRDPSIDNCAGDVNRHYHVILN